MKKQNKIITAILSILIFPLIMAVIYDWFEMLLFKKIN